MTKIPLPELERHCALLTSDVGPILSLRHKVLRPGLPFRTACFKGDHLATTWHCRLIYNEVAADHNPTRAELVCCASFFLNEHKGQRAHQLRGMATDTEHQGWGFGTILLDRALRLILAKTGMRLFWCNARLAAIPFYEKCGWKVVGDTFQIPDIGEHRVMTKEL